MPVPKLTTQQLAEIVAEEDGEVTAQELRKLLAAVDRVVSRALAKGYEVEIGSLGYVSLKEPVQTKPPRGEVRRGKRVSFRERPANRFRWPM